MFAESVSLSHLPYRLRVLVDQRVNTAFPEVCYVGLAREEIEDTPVPLVPGPINDLEHGSGGKAELSGLLLGLVWMVIPIGLQEVFVSFEAEGPAIKDDRNGRHPFMKWRVLRRLRTAAQLRLIDPRRVRLSLSFWTILLLTSGIDLSYGFQDILLKVCCCLHVMECLEDIELQGQLAANLCHGLEGKLAWVLEAVLINPFRFLPGTPFDLPHLTFEDTKSLIVSSVPPHQKVKEFVRIAVDL